MRHFSPHLIDSDPSAWRQRAQSGDDGVQIPEVARPARIRAGGKCEELFPRLLAERYGRTGSAPELLELVLDVRLDVLAAIDKSRKAKRPQVDACEQVLAEPAVPHSLGEVAVRAGDQLKVAGVGSHLADQLLIPMALAGGGSFRTLAPSPHTQANASVVRRFLDVPIVIDREAEDVYRITLGSK